LTSDVDPADRLAALGDLRAFIDLARERGDLEVVQGADAYLEMGALNELSLEKRHPPALLFEDIKGYPSQHRVVMNVRFSRVFVDDLDLDAVKAHRELRKRESAPIDPAFVNTGPVFDNILKGDKVNIRDFPAAHWHEGDGGPYFGMECLVINKDPDSDWVNIGTYRVQVQDERTLTVFIEPGKHGGLIREKYWARGEACPMVVSVGQAPVLGMVACTSSRHGVSEYATAGGQLGRPINVVRGELTGLPIPADAELVFEGFMPPPEEETGPKARSRSGPVITPPKRGPNSPSCAWGRSTTATIPSSSASRRPSLPSRDASRPWAGWRPCGTRWRQPACPG
jgi:UbiD family decarboxylase